MNIHKAGRMALAATSALLAVAGLGPLAAQPVTIPAGDDGQGTITVTLSTADGGTFDSSFNVVPKLIFTPVRGGAKQTIDCGSVPHGGKCSGGFTLSTSGAEWARSSGNPGGFDASSAGVTPIAANIGVSGDGSGTTTYTTKGNAGNNFYTGFSHTSPFPPSPASTTTRWQSTSSTSRRRPLTASRARPRPPLQPRRRPRGVKWRPSSSSPSVSRSSSFEEG